MTELNLKAGMKVRNRYGDIGFLSDNQEADNATYPFTFTEIEDPVNHYTITHEGYHGVLKPKCGEDIVEILEYSEPAEEKHVFNQQEKDILEHAGVAYRIDFDKRSNEGKAYRVSFEVSQAEALRRQFWCDAFLTCIKMNNPNVKADEFANSALAEYDKRFPDHTTIQSHGKV
jgi:hypothetical protein